MRHLLWTCSLVVFTLGCADKSEESEDFLPQEGTWDPDEAVFESDTCGVFDQQGFETNPFLVTVIDDSTFEVDAGGEPISCTLSGKDFTCDSVVDVDDLSGDGVDAVLEFTNTASGTFSSETAAVVRFDFLLTCEGSDCAGFYDFPCTAEVVVDIVAE